MYLTAPLAYRYLWPTTRQCHGPYNRFDHFDSRDLVMGLCKLKTFSHTYHTHFPPVFWRKSSSCVFPRLMPPSVHFLNLIPYCLFWDLAPQNLSSLTRLEILPLSTNCFLSTKKCALVFTYLKPWFSLATVILSFFPAQPNFLKTKSTLGSSIPMLCIYSLCLGSTFSLHWFCFWKDLSLFIAKHLFSV